MNQISNLTDIELETLAVTGGLNLQLLHPLPQGQPLWDRVQDTLHNFAVNQFISDSTHSNGHAARRG